MTNLTFTFGISAALLESNNNSYQQRTDALLSTEDWE